MDNEVHIGRIIKIFSNRIGRKIGSEVSKYGLTSIQSRILAFVSHESAKRDIFQKDMEEEFDIRRSSVTSVLNHMEKNGYIKRVSVSEDARLKKIVLTDKGSDTEKKIHDFIIKFERSLREELTDEEMDIFVKIINRLSEKIAD